MYPEHLFDRTLSVRRVAETPRATGSSAIIEPMTHQVEVRPLSDETTGRTSRSVIR